MDPFSIMVRERGWRQTKKSRGGKKKAAKIFTIKYQV
jgi:hypothetical protein